MGPKRLVTKTKSKEEKEQSLAARKYTKWFKSIPPTEGVIRGQMFSYVFKDAKPGYKNIDELFNTEGDRYFFINIKNIDEYKDNVKFFINTAIDILSIQSEYCFLNDRTEVYYWLVRQPYGFDLWTHSGSHFVKTPLKPNDLSFIMDDWTNEPEEPQPSTSYG